MTTELLDSEGNGPWIRKMEIKAVNYLQVSVLFSVMKPVFTQKEKNEDKETFVHNGKSLGHHDPWALDLPVFLAWMSHTA